MMSINKTRWLRAPAPTVQSPPRRHVFARIERRWSAGPIAVIVGGAVICGSLAMTAAWDTAEARKASVGRASGGFFGGFKGATRGLARGARSVARSRAYKPRHSGRSVRQQVRRDSKRAKKLNKRANNLSFRSPLGKRTNSAIKRSKKLELKAQKARTKALNLHKRYGVFAPKSRKAARKASRLNDRSSAARRQSKKLSKTLGRKLFPLLTGAERARQNAKFGREVLKERRNRNKEAEKAFSRSAPTAPPLMRPLRR